MALFGKGLFRAPLAETTSECRAEALAGPRPVLLFTLLEVDPAAHEEILGKVYAKFDATHKLVFVLSSDQFAPFLARKAALEYFMPLDQQAMHRDMMDWPGYLVEKWGLLQQKWQPAQIVAYGMTPDAFLAAARAQVAA